MLLLLLFVKCVKISRSTHLIEGASQCNLGPQERNVIKLARHFHKERLHPPTVLVSVVRDLHRDHHVLLLARRLNLPPGVWVSWKKVKVVRRRSLGSPGLPSEAGGKSLGKHQVQKRDTSHLVWRTSWGIPRSSHASQEYFTLSFANLDQLSLSISLSYPKVLTEPIHECNCRSLYTVLCYCTGLTFNFTIDLYLYYWLK